MPKSIIDRCVQAPCYNMVTITTLPPSQDLTGPMYYVVPNEIACDIAGAKTVKKKSVTYITALA